MRIRKLRLSGFKSFVEPAELVIERGLTGVVGPNGCGKSNLLEAIRWVMGESSAKSLRGGGMDDVIFSGTAMRASRDFAEVTIFVDKPDAAPDEDRDFEVIRRIERGAGSAYRINGRDVRARDVALMFADSATGAHSPALVSQGRISAIISARPAERRQMLEEAAGISGLHVRRKDAEQKLRATEANLLRLDELIVEMDQRIGALKRQARSAERYRLLSDQIRVAEARLIYARWRDASAASAAAKDEASRAEALVAIATEAQRAAAERQAAAARAIAIARIAAQDLREKASTLGHRLSILASERAGTVRRLAEIAAMTETLARDRAREDTLAIDAAAAITALSEEDRQLAIRIADHSPQQAVIAVQIRDYEAMVQEAELAVAHAQTAQAAELADLRVADAQMIAARQRLQRAEQDAARTGREIEALPTVEPLESRKAVAVAAKADAELAIAEALKALAFAEQQRIATIEARDQAEAKAGSTRAELATLESEINALRKALASGASGDRAIAHLKVTPGYEHALGAALGDDLDAVIGGQGARRWGGADMLQADPALPSDVESLADRVQAPVALARRLAQIGVVDQDDGAIALAVGQRLVTRDGRLRRWDGFVAANVGAAAAERLVRVNRLASLDAQLPEVRLALDAAVAAQAKANGLVGQVREAIDRSRAVLAAAEPRLRHAVRDADAADAAIERLGRQRAALEDRHRQLLGDVGEASQALGDAEAARARVPDGSATRAELERLRNASEARRASLSETRGRASSLAHALANDGQRQQAAKAEIRSWKARAGDAARRIDEMDRRAEAIVKESATLIDRPAALDAEMGALQQDLTAAEADAATARATEQHAERQSHEADAALAEAGEALTAAREARAGAQARFENQELRRVEMSRIAGERFECPAVILPERIGFDSAELGDAATEGHRLEKLMQDRERLGPVNLMAEGELAELEQTRAINQTERDELGQAINRLRGSIGSLNREGRARLLAAFEAVDGHFRRLFSRLFAGGEAHLALIDSDDPLEAGLEIMAQPPGKKLGSLMLLSGGEQALTAVALIFALFLTNPAPICVLDEVDAPLDDANIERFCDLLDQMTIETQTRYLIVTHNAVTMSRMHRLFGVTMIERGVSRLVSVDLGGAEKLLAAE